MNKYSDLIKLIPAVKSVLKHPDEADSITSSVLDALQEYMQLNPEEHLINYMVQFEELGFNKYDQVEDIPIEALNGHAVMVLLIFLYRADHFNNGIFEEYLKSGLILRCLKRLQVLSDPGIHS